jgi:serine/threonine-protein kinase
MVEGFRVMAELGRGAASIIYLVQDPRTKQVWALKHVVKDTEKDQRFLDQAEQEYKIASRLNSPNIRKVERLIRKKDGLLSVSELYLLMEHVDGASVEREPPQLMDEAVYICEQVAHGLAYMHGQGFVHADMKPNNIIVHHDINSEEMAAKIIDLGQSCKSGTVKQRIQGTPDYIAPEQVHRRAITPKTDIYNLGATMYWVLTRRNIPTALAKGDSLVGSLDDHMIEKPTPVLELNPRVHPRLADLIMQCVEVDPEKRPESMSLVADRLNLIHGIIRAEVERNAQV